MKDRPPRQKSVTEAERRITAIMSGLCESPPPITVVRPVFGDGSYEPYPPFMYPPRKEEPAFLYSGFRYRLVMAPGHVLCLCHPCHASELSGRVAGV
ncbi:hypothetical protein AVEN_173617-1 [Araneus ventricosus]|uniref:Uncharacterized protein n=1 Tax=Araneus ventricosus TaxID=182803 RepID=A0A4Y2CSL8_ARAVE|nr:hypothetical protein AVEN_173617-1 [Araneus ventricosus]